MLNKPYALILASILIFGAGGCSTDRFASPQDSLSNKNQASVQRTKLSVLYAGSMTAIMEQKISKDADKRLDIDFQGEGKGSDALAQMISSGIASPDVFISASPRVNQQDLMGAKNKQIVKWYLTLAQDQLVVAYSPKSKFKAQLDKAAQGQIPWYQVLESNGFRLGRTDPVLDPKGADTVLMFQLADDYYHKPSLSTRILGSPENPNQVFPEETLLAQLTSGQVDAIIAYKHEAVEWGVPYITLPNQINLGDAKLADLYAKASFEEKNGHMEKAAPIVFTITIPKTVSHKRKAEDFVKYMISGQGHQLLMADGFTPIATAVGGNKSAVPTNLQNLIQGTLN